MFYGSIPQVADKTIELPDILPQAFRIMLKYIYTDAVEDLSMETVLPTSYCAKKYAIPFLVDACSKYAIRNVDKNTCLALLESVNALDAEKVVGNCLDIVDVNCREIFRSDESLQLKQETLQLIFKRDTLRINEEEVYKAAERWVSDACRINDLKPTGTSYRRMLGNALFLVRFPLMDDEQLTDGPVRLSARMAIMSGLLLGEEAFRICQFKHAPKKPDIPFSGVPRCKSCVTFCGLQWAFLDKPGTGSGMSAADRVFLDDNGYLHLRLSQHNGIWKGADIQSVDAFGFGLYQFQIEAPLDQLDENVVFTVGNPVERRSGIDITFAKWGNRSRRPASYYVTSCPNSSALVVDTPRFHKFNFALDRKCTTHFYQWKSVSVFFSSHHGCQNSLPTVRSNANEFQHWSYDCADAIPQQPLPVAISLSGYLGEAPLDGKDVEIIVRSFRFHRAE